MAIHHTRHIVHSLVGEAILYLQLGRYDWSTWALSILQACWLASCLLAQGIHFAVKCDNSQLFVSGGTESCSVSGKMPRPITSHPLMCMYCLGTSGLRKSRVVICCYSPLFVLTPCLAACLKCTFHRQAASILIQSCCCSAASPLRQAQGGAREGGCEGHRGHGRKRSLQRRLRCL